MFFAYLDGGHPASSSATATTLWAVIPLGLAFVGVFGLPMRPREQPSPETAAG